MKKIIFSLSAPILFAGFIFLSTRSKTNDFQNSNYNLETSNNGFFFNDPDNQVENQNKQPNNISDQNYQNNLNKNKNLATHQRTPEVVKAIYMTACVAATPSFRNELVKLIEETELNSVMIDIKDYTGTISFNSGLAGDEGTGCRTRDLKEFIDELHEKGIYVIGRISVFQDKFYTEYRPDLAVKTKDGENVWLDNKGIGFIDVSATEFWDYIMELSFASHQIGFDEINYDYIRFPSDGRMSDISFPFSDEYIEKYGTDGKVIALENFFKFLDEEVKNYNKNQEYPIITSADLFGMVTTARNDLMIGQILEKALPYFDYIAPMVYPSHYPPGFNGWSNPNHYPGELIYHVMSEGVLRVEEFRENINAEENPELLVRVHKNQLRPWLQDFNYGGQYGPEEVRAQIDATHEAGLNSWMLWAPSNRYTREALKSE